MTLDLSLIMPLPQPVTCANDEVKKKFVEAYGHYLKDKYMGNSFSACTEMDEFNKLQPWLIGELHTACHPTTTLRDAWGLMSTSGYDGSMVSRQFP